MAKAGSTTTKVAKKNLVIVESPAKAKTINKYLGSDYEVHASMGHVRDLPERGISVDIENNFEPTYEITPGRKKVVNTLKAAAKKCDQLYLATDLDREGEAIAWHLSKILGFPEDKTNRVTFNAITRKDIQEAFAAPGKLNIDKVMAQQARRILDRIVGYQISPLLWKKIASGLSAGRVQSVAVRMIVEREKQIRAFKPEEYWLIPAIFTTDLDKNYTDEWQKFIIPKSQDDKGPTLEEKSDWLARRHAFQAELHKINDRQFHAPDKAAADAIFQALKSAKFSVSDVQTKRSSSRSMPPFITSTLQQVASTKLGFSTQRTMRIAQQLYEGVELGEMGSIGLITYMRTDSTNISAEAIGDARRYIQKNIGEKYLPEKPNYFTSRAGAQEAHEAIRPTDVDLTPGGLKQYLEPDQFRLYEIIWQRFVACQMSPVEWDITAVEIQAQTSQGVCVYRAAGRVLVFDGYTRIWATGTTEQQLPEMKFGQQVNAVDITAEQHFTKPPARYTEASLVKALEKEGIGRPSTYASIISTIQDRKYVEQIDKKFHATDLGEVVTDKLIDFFPKLMDVAFTRHMEEQLDKIESQHLDWRDVLNEFYGPFKQNLEQAGEEMKHAKAETRPSEYNCPNCGKQLLYRFGKNGKFLSCSGYPVCKFTSPCDAQGKMVKDEPTEHKCPKCGKPMVKKLGRFGAFLGCSDYPNCKTIQRIDKQGNVKPPAAPPQPTGLKCHKCKEGELVIRQSKRGPFMGCSRFPKCRTIVSIKNLEQLKDLQAKGQWPPQTDEQTEKLPGKNEKAKPTKKKASSR